MIIKAKDGFWFDISEETIVPDEFKIMMKNFKSGEYLVNAILNNKLFKDFYYTLPITTFRSMGD